MFALSCSPRTVQIVNHDATSKTPAIDHSLCELLEERTNLLLCELEDLAKMKLDSAPRAKVAKKRAATIHAAKLLVQAARARAALHGMKSPASIGRTGKSAMLAAASVASGALARAEIHSGHLCV